MVGCEGVIVMIPEAGISNQNAIADALTRIAEAIEAQTKEQHDIGDKVVSALLALTRDVFGVDGAVDEYERALSIVKMARK
jgi:hypothetical protein